MQPFRHVARYAIGVVAIALLAFGIPGVHAAPTAEPGIGQSGDHFFCIAITRTKDHFVFPSDPSCSATEFPGLVGTFFDVTFKAPLGTRTATIGNVTFRHPKSKASINILTALVQGSSLSATFNFFDSNAPSGYFTIKLTNAVVTEDNQYLPDTNGSSGAASVPLMEQVTLNFRGIVESSGGATFTFSRR